MSSFVFILDSEPAESSDLFRSLNVSHELEPTPFGALYIRGPSIKILLRTSKTLILHHGECLTQSEIDRVQTLSTPPDFGWKKHRGTLMYLDGPNHRLHISNDLVGSFPVYYGTSRSGKRFAVGSSLSEVRALLDVKPDAIGVYQFLTSGFCVGSRTLADSISQLTIHDTLSVHYEHGTPRQKIQKHPHLWLDPRLERRRSVIDGLCDIWQSETKVLDGAQLMMSAGWDSRAILAGVSANRLNDRIFAYSHGDTGGRELNIAGSICSRLGVRHTRRAISPASFCPATADAIMDEVDTYVFPYWWEAARFGRAELSVTKITGGLYGPLMGGHNNVPDKGPKRRRLWSLLRYLGGREHPANSNSIESMKAAKELLVPKTHYRQWCIRDEISAEQSHWILDAVRDDTNAILETYSSLGIEAVESLVEAFEVDHRLRQLINGQLLSGTSQLAARVPFTNPELIEIATSLPLSRRVHNILHREVIRRLEPSLLEYPMAATLARASRPIVVQEFSRIERIFLEKIAGVGHHLSSRKVPTPRFGWPAFGFLRTHEPFHQIVDSLKLDIWDKQRIHEVIRATDGTLHSVFEMMGKIKTADYRLTAGERVY